MMLHRHFEEDGKAGDKLTTTETLNKTDEEFVSEVFPPDPEPKTRKRRKTDE